MKICQAFAKNGHEVVLFARRSEEQVDDEYHYCYSVDPCFDIEKQAWPPLRIVGRWLYTRQVKQKILRKPLPDIFYGRDAYSLLEVAPTGRPLTYDAHVPPVNRIHKLCRSSPSALQKPETSCCELRRSAERVHPAVSLDEQGSCAGSTQRCRVA